MKINRTILVRLLWIFAGVSLLLLCYDLIRFFGLGEEAGVGVFGLAATLVGTIFIAIELSAIRPVADTVSRRRS